MAPVVHHKPPEHQPVASAPSAAPQRPNHSARLTPVTGTPRLTYNSCWWWRAHTGHCHVANLCTLHWQRAKWFLTLTSLKPAGQQQVVFDPSAGPPWEI